MLRLAEAPESGEAPSLFGEGPVLFVPPLFGRFKLKMGTGVFCFSFFYSFCFWLRVLD